MAEECGLSLGGATSATLLIVADDFGLRPSYDRGILDAARAGAIDAASVMVGRAPERVDELMATGVRVGLHLERTGPREAPERGMVLEQLAAFERLVGRRPDHVDGHHHCHALGAAAAIVAEIAAERALAVRSVGSSHRRLLRDAGVRTPDLLVGRLREDGPVLPPELLTLPAGVETVEWMVHPGHPDPQSGSSYDGGRGEDLEALLAFEPPPGLVRSRREGYLQIG